MVAECNLVLAGVVVNGVVANVVVSISMVVKFAVAANLIVVVVLFQSLGLLNLLLPLTSLLLFLHQNCLCSSTANNIQS